MVASGAWSDDSEFATEVAVETEDGARLQRFVPLAQGKPARWFSTERLHAKFVDCGSVAMAADSLEAAWQSLAGLDSAGGCDAVLRALAAAPTERA